jgi:hemerythrin-like domain-containing protein
MHAAHRHWLAEHDALYAALEGVLYLSTRIATGVAPEHRDADFAALRAIFVYLGNYPERVHHPREESTLFAAVGGRDAGIDKAIASLREQHATSLANVMRMRHFVNSAEFGGDEDLVTLREQCQQFVASYFVHIETEERDVLAPAEPLLSDDEWAWIASELAADRDPLAGLARVANFDQLIATIDALAPAAIGVGAR